MNSKLDYSKCFAFRNFKLSTNPAEYEFSEIDNQPPMRTLPREQDMFTLFEFSAKWDPGPNHAMPGSRTGHQGIHGSEQRHSETSTSSLKCFVMGETKSAGEARYIHGECRKRNMGLFMVGTTRKITSTRLAILPPISRCIQTHRDTGLS
jgi:hypothetical protein